MSCAVLDIHACRNGQTNYGVYYTCEDESRTRLPLVMPQRKTENCQSNSLGAQG